MNALDGRKLDHGTLERLRIRAVGRVEAGESPEVVIESLGFSRPRIYEWLAAYREGGVEALKAKPVPGRPRKLTSAQMQRLYRTITSKNPLQLRFRSALWTRSMVRELIRDEFAVRLSEVSVGRLLRTLGLSPQKALRRASQQDPESVARWEKEVYPAIQRRAKRREAQILFADESRVQPDYRSGTTWPQVGQTPVVASPGARSSINLLSALSPRGELRFMGIEGRLGAGRFIEFLGRLVQAVERPVLLIVDGHPVHRSRSVRDFVDSTGGMLELHYLPPYSPELDSAEHGWASGGRRARTSHHRQAAHAIVEGKRGSAAP